MKKGDLVLYKGVVCTYDSPSVRKGMCFIRTTFDQKWLDEPYLEEQDYYVYRVVEDKVTSAVHCNEDAIHLLRRE